MGLLNAKPLGAEVSRAQRRWAGLARYGLALLYVGLALGLALTLEHFRFRDGAVPLLLFACAISSWYGGRGPALLAFILSTAAFYWYFIEPVRTIYILRSEIPYFIIFASFCLLIVWFSTVRRRAEGVLREQANLLSLTHDAVIVMGMEGVIKYWNRGAEGRYGWTAEEAVGRVVHDLLKTGFPAVQEEIKGEVIRTGRWEGELTQTTKDGAQVVVASRWALQRDNRGAPVAILETNNDITQRKRAEDALRESERYLAESERLSHTGSWALDLACDKYVYVSDEDFRIWGLDPKGGPPSREAVFQLIHPEDRSRCREFFEKSLREKTDSADEYRILLPDGTVKHVHTTRHPLLNDAGHVVKLMGTSVDITERKRAEEALRRSEAYLAEGQRLAHTGSFASDCTTRPLFWSEELYRIFGFDPQQGLPTRDQPLQRIHPEDMERFLQAWDRAIRQKLDAEVKYRVVLPDGTIKHAHGIAHPVLDPKGEVVELVGTVIDITERKRAEEALRESEMRFRTFVDHVADAIVIQDDKGIIVDVNRRGCEGLGYTRQEVIGKTPDASFCLNTDRQAAELELAHRAADETVTDTHSHQRKDGTIFPVEVHTRSFWYSGRRLLLKVARDITDRKRAEEERDRLRQLEADLAHINRVSMMGELAASVAHEVNQPISGVVSNGSACLRWLGRDVPDIEEAREAARRIVRDGKRAGEIIARIRALTKRAATPIEKLGLNETIREVLALVVDEAKRKGVTIQTHFTDDLSPVSGDRVQLQQVVLNLVMNGIEAMSSAGGRPGELAITTRNVDAGQVQVTVADSGIGLDPNTIDKIFDPFYTTKPGGMGMGLSICRSILQTHGGRIWAAANNSRGTSFHFALPKYDKAESHADVAGV